MQPHDDNDVRKALDLAFPPVDQELRRDLWPAMLSRMVQPRRAVPWYDWALAGAIAGMCIFFPKLVLLLAYHL